MPCRGGGVHPFGLLAKIDPVHHIVDLRENNDFLVILAGLHLVRNKIERQPVEDDVVADGQNGQKRQRRKRGDKAGKQTIVMRQRVKTRARGADSFGGTGAQKEIARTDQQNCDE